MSWVLHESDCLDAMRAMPSASVNCVITDPPYPHIKRSYGFWTEAEWFALMDPVVEECRRLLTPTGSAVFILQPNSERVGRMRPWLFDFQAKWCRRWGMVQDAWWWNTAALPIGGATEGRLMRPSLKACVWLGPPDCYRDQDSVLWTETDSNKASRQAGRATREVSSSGMRVNRLDMGKASSIRGGVTPFNLIPVENNWKPDSAGSHGHGAGTPLALARWWTRYICPPGGTVLDPFAGSGTMGLAALAEGRRFVGVERDAGYAAIARERLTAAEQRAPAAPAASLFA